ncbi:MAG TPA: YIP1 family protein [Verrucomicrobiae bacterium]
MEETPPIIENRPPETQRQSTSLAARLLNVFAIPGDVFEEVKNSAMCTANWLVPALLLIVVGCIGASLVYSQPAIQQQVREMQDKVMDKLVEKGRLTKEQADQQREAGAVSSRIGAYIGPVFYALASPFWWGFLVWLLGTKVLKGSFPFMKAVEVVGLGNAIAILGSVVTTLLMVSLGSLGATPSPALLVKDYDPQKTSQALLQLPNVITLWLLAVRSIGLAKLGGTRFVPAAVWVFGLWVLQTSVLLGIGLAMKAMLGL